MSTDFETTALQYHRGPRPGKLAIVATKPMETQRDLALAYSPGVAAACEVIVRDPAEIATVTARSNLVAVITNGTAVLGLGNIGALAAKPVMEGKAVLFKKFANIDVFDIEINEPDPEEFIKTVARLEPTFGGISLEDVKAPECFRIERALRNRMRIPVFHDDQHGTAIIVAAAMLNGLRVVGKKIEDIKLVCSGAGAAAIACLNLLMTLGLRREHVFVVDRAGVIYQGRQGGLDEWKALYARETDARTLADVIPGADVFLGLSAPGVLKPEMAATMAERPLIFALANPVPEIMPEVAKQVRPDAVIATGRSDYPNQVNNVLCFPYIFRGALDVGATTINEEMKLACVHALAELATAEPSDMVTKAYGGRPSRFGPEYLIPKPFDPRLILRIAPAVAKAAMDSGVATRPIQDFETYRDQLIQFVYQSGLLMRPVFDRAKQAPKRLAFAEGEDRRVLQAAQQVVDEHIAFPILVGRPAVIEDRMRQLSLRLRPGVDCEIVNILQDRRYRSYWTEYHELLGRKGISPEEAKRVLRTNATVVAAVMVRKGEADCMLCGAVGPFSNHLADVRDVIGPRSGVCNLSTLTALTLPTGTFFICDSHINPDPTVDELVEMALLAAEHVQSFGIRPKIALLSHSNFGTHDTPSAWKMREAVRILHEHHSELEVDGEMHADTALVEQIRNAIYPGSRLTGQANLFIMPNLDAAHIAYSMLKILGGGASVGPMLMGAAKPAHILTQSVTVRGLLNMSAVTVAQSAQATLPQLANP